MYVPSLLFPEREVDGLDVLEILTALNQHLASFMLQMAGMFTWKEEPLEKW